MTRPTLSVIIPSRTCEAQTTFLTHALESIEAQTVRDEFAISIIVAVDRGCRPALDAFASHVEMTIAESHETQSQAAALNAALRQSGSQFVAFLEDDDAWYPAFLAHATAMLAAGAGFVSSTQLEFDETDSVVRINDFPTASGWFMPAQTLERVGEFNESLRLHLDNEWLGRLAETRVRRCHLAESTAPREASLMRQVRPWLYNVLACGGTSSEIVRHVSPIPLVRRLVHAQSGMARIARDPEFRRISDAERSALRERFGRLPW